MESDLDLKALFEAMRHYDVSAISFDANEIWYPWGGLEMYWNPLEADAPDLAFQLLDNMEERGWRVRIERYHLDEGGFPFYVSWRRGEKEPSFGEIPKAEGFYSFEQSRTAAAAKAFIGTAFIESKWGAETDQKAEVSR